ncbi:MAG TPA: hypothetical protein VHB30_07825, partial [Solirubrobacteraceae bacterium]|nr:hypothetical protein [Solirubrobacteraceae bacterium]
GLWVANVHAQVRPADAARADVAAAADAALEWAGEAPLVLGGDLNLRAPDPPEGLTLAGGHDVDHVLARGLRPRGPARTLDARPLSDHLPVLAELELETAR